MRHLVQRILVVVGLLAAGAVALPLAAQEVQEDFKEMVRAEVLEILDERTRPITGTDRERLVQEVAIEVLEGERAGARATFENDLVELTPGDNIFVSRIVGIDGKEHFIFHDYDRRWQLVAAASLFVILLLWFAGKQGARALLSLLLSIGAILFVLIPALLNGYSPAWTSLGIAAVVLALVLFLTHGINARSVIAFVGTTSAVALTCAIAAIWVSWMKLTGFVSDATVYLNFSTDFQLDFTGLLLGSIIIGVLGVLDDVSITQASVVQELKAANPSFGLRDLYQRSIRVGRDHVGSLVNTLALAYVGVSLPLVLLLARTDASLASLINQEIVAAEILRIIVGSIGLIMAVPLTTVAAAWWFAPREVDPNEVVEHCGHHH